jgi:hypothetical protein
MSNELFTRGRWCQFHGLYCEEAKSVHHTQWDSSHDVSAIREDGSRYHIATFRHAADAAFVEQLINDYQAGRLVRVEQ